MKCEEFCAEIQDLALTGPDFELTDSRLQSHFTKCGQCQQYVAESREAWMVLPAALDRPQLPPGLEDRIVGQIESNVGIPVIRDSAAFELGKYAFAAVALCCLVMATFPWARNAIEDGKITEDEERRIIALAKQTDRMDRIEASLSKSSLRNVSLIIDEPRRRQAYFVFDEVSKEAHFFASDLPGLDNEMYRVWLVPHDNSATVTAPVELSGSMIGAAVVMVPGNIHAYREIMVTIELIGAPATPSENVFFRAMLQF